MTCSRNARAKKMWRFHIFGIKTQYIPIEKVCDGSFDCLLNEDETENTCKTFPITMAISYSSAIVCGIVTVMICLKSFNSVTHKFMCKQCVKKHSYCLENQQWIKKCNNFSSPHFLYCW